MIWVTPGWFNAYAVIVGLVIGSFLNVVIARLPAGKSIVRPGSRCPRCRKPVRWYDNIPVLSYLILRGRCRGCSKPIGLRYPLVELMTAILFLAAAMKWGPGAEALLRAWPFLALLIAITFIDLDHRIIPDSLSLSGLGLGLATSFLATDVGVLDSIAGAGVGFGVFYAIAWIYERRSGRVGLGGGDVKLLAMIGAYTGLQGVFVTMLISSVLGSGVGIAWAALQKKGDVMKVAIPYGPFLVIGALYVYLLGDLLWLPFTNPM